jgi:hypothetical protein
LLVPDDDITTMMATTTAAATRTAPRARRSVLVFVSFVADGGVATGYFFLLATLSR